MAEVIWSCLKCYLLVKWQSVLGHLGFPQTVSLFPLQSTRPTSPRHFPLVFQPSSGLGFLLRILKTYPHFWSCSPRANDFLRSHSTTSWQPLEGCFEGDFFPHVRGLLSSSQPKRHETTTTAGTIFPGFPARHWGYPSGSLDDLR